MPEPVLLFDRSRLGVALRYDDAPELGAELTRHLLPDRLTEVIAEADRTIGNRICEKDAPAIIRHLHRAIARPTLRVDAHCGAQVDIGLCKIVRPHLVPPVEKLRLPVLERALQRPIV